MSTLANGNVRLTKDIRNRIANDILRYRFLRTKDTIKELTHKHASLAQAVYSSQISADMESKINALPNGWIPESDYVYVTFGTDQNQLRFDGFIGGYLPYKMTKVLDFTYDTGKIKKRIPSSMSHRFCKFDARHELSSKFADFKRSADKFKNEFEESERILKATLDATTTSARLIEQWPECRPFVEKVVGANSKSTALALPTSILNEKFGLPVPA